MGDGLDAQIRAHLQEHGRISWQTALGIAEWVIYPALAVRLTSGQCKEFMVERGRWRETHNVICRILKRKYAKDNGAISDGSRGIIYANWQRPESAGAAAERAPVSGGDPGGKVSDQVVPAGAPPELRQSGTRKRGRPRGPLRVPPQAPAPDCLIENSGDNQ
jgi:hypothetical protein